VERQPSHVRLDRAENHRPPLLVDVPYFTGTQHPDQFHNWLNNNERVFKWYRLSDSEKVEFATMKMIDNAPLYWKAREREREVLGAPGFTWAEMKDK